jgi:CMP-N,N'-diacetyllegionaminic acid synthase
MLCNKRIIALIPARAGSKSISGKNLAPLAGKSLLVRAVDCARAVSSVDRVIVSSDGPDILEAGRVAGAEAWERPAHLSTDAALVIDTIRDVIARLRAEGETAGVMILLEPTCPLRSPEDVRACLRLVAEEGYDSAATVKEAELNPHRAWRLEGNAVVPYMDGAAPWLPRQKLAPAYQLSGGCYAFRMDELPPGSPGLLYGRMGAVVVPRERSVDVDNPVDLILAEALLSRMADFG